MEKEPKQRVHDIADVRLAMEGAFETTADESATTLLVSQSVGWRHGLPWVAGVVLAVITGLAVWTLTRPGPQVPRSHARFVVTTPPDGPLRLTGSQTDVAISPDGTRLVYMSDTGSRSGAAFGTGRRLYRRDLDQLVATPLPGTEGARNPFFSPDGESVGFQDSRDGVIRRVSVHGGTPVPICDVPADLLGVSWGPDDTIVFAESSSRELWRVPAVGGQPELLTEVESEQREVRHFCPEFLPGGNAVLFGIGTRGSSIENAQIAVLSLETGEQKTVLRGGSNPHYLPTGHLVYGVDRTLWAVPFDLDHLEVTGDPVRVLTDVITKDSGAVNVMVSRNGSLVYLSGTAAATAESELVLVDREGRGIPATEVTADYFYPRFAPDGRLAVVIAEVQGAVGDGDADVWILDLERGTRTSVTFEGGNNWPIWSPGGSRLAFTRDGGIHWAPADGSGQPEKLFAGIWALRPGELRSKATMKKAERRISISTPS